MLPFITGLKGYVDGLLSFIRKANLLILAGYLILKNLRKIEASGTNKIGVESLQSIGYIRGESGFPDFSDVEVCRLGHRTRVVILVVQLSPMLIIVVNSCLLNHKH